MDLAARYMYVKNRHRNTSIVSDMLSTLKWRGLQDRRRDARLCMMYKMDRRLVGIKKDKRLALAKKKNTRAQLFKANDIVS